MKDATEIQAKVLNISDSEITYQKWSNQKGPSYTISKSTIFFIKYQNGDKEVFGKATSLSSSSSSKNVKVNSYSLLDKTDKNRYGKAVFQGYVAFSSLSGQYVLSPGFDLSMGARIWDVAYVGLETGFAYPFFGNSNVGYEGTWAVPIGVNLRGYFPTGTKKYPFVDLTLGSMVMNGYSPFHCHLMFGCDFNRFTLSIGWDRMKIQTVNVDSFAINIGVRFGK